MSEQPERGIERERERESSLSYFANDLFREEGREGKKTKRISSAAAAASFSVQSAVQNIITDTRDDDDVRRTSSLFGGRGERGRTGGGDCDRDLERFILSFKRDQVQSKNADFSFCVFNFIHPMSNNKD